MKKFLVVAFILLVNVHLRSQENYPFVFETDTQAVQHIEEWKDWKFGLLMHWGTYSIWGIVESWSLCPEDVGWTQRRKGRYQNYFEYKSDYENLRKQFNPVKFNPEKWAKAAKGAGIKYMVFTTKHHDGFCMFDTKQTDYKITAADVPFSSNPRADVTKEIFSAFRNEGIHTGAYFSKPDWHNENFWWPYFPPMNRNVNYEISKYPERWKAFQDFTYNQIRELMTGYGKLDILWLDGAWVMPDSNVDKKVDWQKNIPRGQDINMPRIAAMCRQEQPGIIIVDRWVPGPFENYHTPEQQIPEKPLPYPWETCMTMGGSWSYAPNDKYKSTTTLIHNLMNIVSKGGNYLLNIGPGPDGEWHEEAYQKLQEIGEWMKINGDAVYETRAIAPYRDDKVCFTRKKDGSVYAVYLMEDKESVPSTIQFSGIIPSKKAVLSLSGYSKKLKWKTENNRTTVYLPSGYSARHAISIHISQVNQ